jgi:hypothetical protein
MDNEPIEFTKDMEGIGSVTTRPELVGSAA